MISLPERWAGLQFIKLQHERTALARDNHQSEFKSVNGLGQLRARISIREYMLMRQQYGDQCWSDPDFVRAYLRDNPENKIKTRYGTRGQEILCR